MSPPVPSFRPAPSDRVEQSEQLLGSNALVFISQFGAASLAGRAADLPAVGRDECVVLQDEQHDVLGCDVGNEGPEALCSVRTLGVRWRWPAS